MLSICFILCNRGKASEVNRSLKGRSQERKDIRARAESILFLLLKRGFLDLQQKASKEGERACIHVRVGAKTAAVKPRSFTSLRPVSQSFFLNQFVSAVPEMTTDAMK